MKVLIPAAGLGTRLRPHTYHRPKPLLHVAGATVLDHVLDRLQSLPIEEMIFIVGHLGDQLEAHARKRVTVPLRFVTQAELKGQAHAISLAASWLSGPLLIIFVDTIFETDLSGLELTGRDGVIFVREVADPRRFGVVLLDDDGFITQFVEKSAEPKSNLAIAGLYYLRDGAWLARSVHKLLELGIQTKGEYYLADALQLMVSEGARFLTRRLTIWEDCGTREALLSANRYLLGQMAGGGAADATVVASVLRPPVQIASGARLCDSVIGPYVFVGKDCRIDSSVVGPYVSLADGASVVGSVVRDSIIEAGATLSGARLEASLIGADVLVRDAGQQLSLGDGSQLDLGLEHPPGGAPDAA